MVAKLQFRNGTKAEWSLANPVLLDGELGVETDTQFYKIGDGITAWKLLTYAGTKGTHGVNKTTGGESPMTIEYYPSATAPAGWLPCDGTSRPRASYPSLNTLNGIAATGPGVGAQYGTPAYNGATVSSNKSQTDGNTSTVGAGFAFDGINTTNGDGPCWSVYGYPYDSVYPWITLSFEQARVVTGYYMSARAQSAWMISAWIIDASNDGTTWTTLDSKSGQYLAGAGVTGSINTSQMSSFSVTNSTAYKHYRMTATMSTDSGYYIALPEMAYVTTVIPADSSVIVLPNLSNITSSGITLYPYIKV